MSASPTPTAHARRWWRRSRAAIALIAIVLATAACTAPMQLAGPDGVILVPPGQTTSVDITLSNVASGATFEFEGAVDDLTVGIERTSSSTLRVDLTTPPNVEAQTIDARVIVREPERAARIPMRLELQAYFTVTGTLARDDLTDDDGSVSVQSSGGGTLLAQALAPFGGVAGYVESVSANVSPASGRAFSIRPEMVRALRVIAGEVDIEDEYVVAVAADGRVLGSGRADPETGRWRIDSLISGEEFALLRGRAVDEAERLHGEVDIICIEPLEVGVRDDDVSEFVRTRRTRALLLRYATEQLAEAPQVLVSADGSVAPARWQRVIDVGSLRTNDASAKMASLDPALERDALDPGPGSAFLDANGAFREELLACGASERLELSFQLDLEITESNEVQDLRTNGVIAALGLEELSVPTSFSGFADANTNFDLPSGGSYAGAPRASGVPEQTASEAALRPSFVPYVMSSTNYAISFTSPFGPFEFNPDVQQLLPVQTDACVTNFSTCDFAGGLTPIVDLAELLTPFATRVSATERGIAVQGSASLGRVNLVGRVVTEDGTPLASQLVTATCFETTLALARSDESGQFVLQVTEDFGFGPAECIVSTTRRGFTFFPSFEVVPRPGTALIDPLIGTAR